MNLGGAIHLNKTGIFILSVLLFILILYTFSNGSETSSKKPNQISLKHLLASALKASENGGIEVVAVKDKLDIRSKGKTKEGVLESVTTADFRSHCLMTETLKYNFPQLHIISEENVKECEKVEESDLKPDVLANIQDEYVDLNDVTVWIDPLDATKEYTEKLYDYVTTMVCVAVNGKPVIGVVHKPFSKVTSWAWVGKNVSKDLENLKFTKNEKVKVIISRSHKGEIENVLKANFRDYETIIAAGAGYKVLEVAEHRADAYLHITAIKKWDICAGNAIINGVGGSMVTKSGRLIDYSAKTDALNDDGLIVTSSSKIRDIFINKL